MEYSSTPASQEASNTSNCLEQASLDPCDVTRHGDSTRQTNPCLEKMISRLSGSLIWSIRTPETDEEAAVERRPPRLETSEPDGPRCDMCCEPPILRRLYARLDSDDEATSDLSDEAFKAGLASPPSIVSSLRARSLVQRLHRLFTRALRHRLSPLFAKSHDDTTADSFELPDLANPPTAEKWRTQLEQVKSTVYSHASNGDFADSERELDHRPLLDLFHQFTRHSSHGKSDTFHPNAKFTPVLLGRVAEKRVNREM